MGGWGRQGYLCCSIIPLRNLRTSYAYVFVIRVQRSYVLLLLELHRLHNTWVLADNTYCRSSTPRR